MIEIKYIIGGVALAWVLINWIEYLYDYIYISITNKKVSFIFYKIDRFFKRFNCLKCWSFWTTLVISQDILLASIAGLLAYLLDAYVLKKKIEL